MDIINLTSEYQNFSLAVYNVSVTEILNQNINFRKSSFLRTSELIFATITPVIIVIGLIGNVLSLAVFSSKSLRKLTASSYLAALSLADMCTLLFYVTIEWLRRGLGIIHHDAKLEILDYNGVCQVLIYLAYLSRFMSSWVIVTFTIERYIGICHPLKSFNRGAKKVIICLLMFASVLVIYKPAMTISSTLTKGQTACRPNPAVPELLSYIMDLMFAVSITFVPFVIITLLNILIVRALYIRNRSRDALSEDTHTRIRLEFTLILVAISFFFIAFNLPFTAVWSRYFLTAHPIYNAKSFSIVDNDYWIALLNVTRTVFYMNYCVNFFLYSITGKYFRTNLVRMLCCSVKSRGRGTYISCQFVGNSTMATSAPYQYKNGHTFRTNNEDDV